MSPSISTHIRSRQQEGSCNSCQRRDQEIVILIQLNTLSFRLCNDCADTLIDQLTAANITPKGQPQP